MASSVQSSLEAAASAAGFELSDSPDFLNTSAPQPQETQVQEPVMEQALVQQETEFVADSTESSLNETSSDVDIDSLVLRYLNETKGTNLTSWDEFTTTPNTIETNTPELPENIKVILDFVEKTGRSPEDWFRYQSINPSEMDDMVVMRLSMANDYPNLSQDEIGLMLDKKYKLNDQLYDEEEVRFSQLQLKIDSEKARKQLDEYRNGFMLPEPKPTTEEVQSPINDTWIADMSKTVDSLQDIEFDLGKGKSFKFSLEDNYKSSLKDKNARLDEYFDPYVGKDGKWDHALLSSHRAIIDNIDAIVSSAYKQGLGDGQKTLVEKAANVDARSPIQNARESNPIHDQILQAFLGGEKMMTFKK